MKSKQTITIRHDVLKRGDYFAMNVPVYRRKYWLFGKWIQTGVRRKVFVVK